MEYKINFNFFMEKFTKYKFNMCLLAHIYLVAVYFFFYFETKNDFTKRKYQYPELLDFSCQGEKNSITKNHHRNTQKMEIAATIEDNELSKTFGVF